MRARKVDSNQAAIVKALRKIPGVSVQILAATGKGVPDLLIGYRSVNYLVEVKDPTKPKADRVLTPEQVRFHGEWTGQCCTCMTLDDTLRVIGITPYTIPVFLQPASSLVSIDSKH